MAWRKDVERELRFYPWVKKRSFDVWLKARSANSTKKMRKVIRTAFPDMASVVVEPFVSDNNKHKFLATTGAYTQNNTNPAFYGRRAQVSTGAVREFSPDAQRPKTRRRPRPNHGTIGLPTKDYVGLPFNATPTQKLEG